MVLGSRVWLDGNATIGDGVGELGDLDPISCFLGI